MAVQLGAIEKNVPIPTRITNSRTSPIILRLLELQPGDSFIVKGNTTAEKVRQLILNWKGRHRKVPEVAAKKFTVMKERQHVRIWRVE